MNRKFDRDVWAPPPPDSASAGPSPAPALSKFQEHFKNRMTTVGKDGSGAQLVATAGGGPSSSAGAAPQRKTPSKGPSDGQPQRRQAKPERRTGAAGAFRFQTPDEYISALESHHQQQQQQQERAASAEGSGVRSGGSPAGSESDGSCEVVEVGPAGVASVNAARGEAMARRVSEVLVSDFMSQLRDRRAGSGPHAPPPPPAAAAAAATLQPGAPPKRRPSSGQRLSPLPSPRPTPAVEHVEEVRQPQRQRQGPREPRRRASADDPVPVRKAVPAAAVQGVKRSGAGGTVSAPPVMSAPSTRAARKTQTPPQPQAPQPQHRTKTAHPGPTVVSPSSEAPPARSRPQPERAATPTTPPDSGSEGDGEGGRRPRGYTPYSLKDYHKMMAEAQRLRPGGLGPADTDEQREARAKKERQREYGKRATQLALQALAEQQQQRQQQQRATPRGEAAERTGADSGPGARGGSNEAVHAAADVKKSVTPATAAAAPAAAAPSKLAASARGDETSSDDDDVGSSSSSQEDADSGTGDGSGSDPRASAALRERQQRHEASRASLGVIRQPPPRELIQAKKRRARALEYAKRSVPKPTVAPRQRPGSGAADCSAGGGGGSSGGHTPGGKRGSGLTDAQQRIADLEARHEQNKEAVAAIRRQLCL